MKISIIGCGWLGLPLGEALVTHGYEVRGSTTRKEKFADLQRAGIQPVWLEFTPEPNGDLAALLPADVLIVSIPPRAGKYGDAYHPQQIRALSERLADFTGKILYISSTSVYPETNTTLDETSSVLSDHPLIQAETILKGEHTTLLRCGGLMGYDRIPGKYFIGKTVDTGNVPVNFIHRDDVIGIIRTIIEQEKWGSTYNAVAPLHPIRKDVYERNAAQHGWAPPVFEEPTEPIPFKIISGERVIRELSYDFLYPDPLAFL